jgi:hypothetical protein
VNFHPTLEAFAAELKALTREDFLELQTVPLLLISLDGLPPNVSRELAFARTVSLDGSTDPAAGQVTHDPTRTIVALVAKSERNDQPIITLGRSIQNDIVVPGPSVSKFHAFFKIDPKTGEVSISDADSSFGTKVNKKSLEPGVRHALATGDTLMFAETATATYLTPEGCYGYMQVILRIAGRKKPK